MGINSSTTSTIQHHSSSNPGPHCPQRLHSIPNPGNSYSSDSPTLATTIPSDGQQSIASHHCSTTSGGNRSTTSRTCFNSRRKLTGGWFRHLHFTSNCSRKTLRKKNRVYQPRNGSSAISATKRRSTGSIAVTPRLIHPDPRHRFGIVVGAKRLSMVLIQSKKVCVSGSAVQR